MSETEKILKEVKNLANHNNMVERVGIPPMRMENIEASEVLVCLYYLMMDLGIEAGCNFDRDLLAKEICVVK